MGQWDGLNGGRSPIDFNGTATVLITTVLHATSLEQGARKVVLFNRTTLARPVTSAAGFGATPRKGRIFQQLLILT